MSDRHPTSGPDDDRHRAMHVVCGWPYPSPYCGTCMTFETARDVDLIGCVRTEIETAMVITWRPRAELMDMMDDGTFVIVLGVDKAPMTAATARQLADVLRAAADGCG
jgi:hypothetical protein